ncbi:MAG: 50S ribosomal protein L30e [Candidatus Thermoplasmatota archaeon]|nr:50S ribosomal protein L30e [Candidatus Thermoplasmatota archaeon]
MLDVERLLKNTVKKGTVKIGTKEVKTAITEGKAKIVVLANNCQKSDSIEKLAKEKKIPTYTCESNSINLGYTCGKAFAVSVFAVLDDGGSNILQLIKKR